MCIQTTLLEANNCTLKLKIIYNFHNIDFDALLIENRFIVLRIFHRIELNAKEKQVICVVCARFFFVCTSLCTLVDNFGNSTFHSRWPTAWTLCSFDEHTRRFLINHWIQLLFFLFIEVILVPCLFASYSKMPKIYM